MGKQFGFAMDANDEKRFLDVLYLVKVKFNGKISKSDVNMKV